MGVCVGVWVWVWVCVCGCVGGCVWVCGRVGGCVSNEFRGDFNTYSYTYMNIPSSSVILTEAELREPMTAF